MTAFDRAQAAYDAAEPDWSDEDEAQHEGDYEASFYDQDEEESWGPDSAQQRLERGPS